MIGDSPMRWTPQFSQVLLIMLMMNVALAYVMGMSPVFGLIGIIMLTTSILVLQFTKRKS